MRFRLYLKNPESGNIIDMTNTANQYMISSLSGLAPPKAAVSTTRYAGSDGSYLSNAVLEKRNVVINFVMSGAGLEKRRQKLYNTVKVRKSVRIIYETLKTSVYIDGIVETCTVSNFEQNTTGQISVICTDPFWRNTATDNIVLDTLFSAFEFPFAIEEEGIEFSYYDNTIAADILNDGEETGFIAEITVSGMVKNPMLLNDETDEFLKINGTFEQGDLIIIDTRTMHKSITLVRKAVRTNIINKFNSDSTWLTLITGGNRFRISAASGTEYLHVEFFHQNIYLGV